MKDAGAWEVSSLWVTIVMGLLAVEIASRGACTRFVLRETLLLLMQLDLQAQRVVRWLYPPRFVVLGQCQKRGVCCKQIIFNPPGLVKRTWLLQLFAAYHRVAHNFSAVARGPNGEVFFSCGHLKSDGRCGIYRYRPLLCRNFPVLPWFEPPKILPGCGFRMAPRVVAKMTTRPSLPIVNAHVAVHHPSPVRSPTQDAATPPVPSRSAPDTSRNGLDRATGRLPAEELPEHYELFDDS